MTDRELIHELKGLVETVVDAYESAPRSFTIINGVAWISVILTPAWIERAKELTAESK